MKIDKKYIGIDCRMINYSGIGTYIKNLIPLVISELNDIKYFLLGNKTKMLTAGLLNNSNVEYIEFDAPIYSIKEQFVIPRLIPKNTTVFWSPHYNIPLMYTGKLFVTVHDLNHLALTQSGFSWAEKKYAKYFFKKILQKADGIVTVSNFTRNEYIKYFDIDKYSEQLLVVHNGLAIKEPTGGDKPYKKPYILTVGNVKPHKNMSRLLEAYNIIKDSIPHDLIIVGKKTGFIRGDENLLKKVDAFDRRVIMTGYLSDEELYSYYSHADLFVFPSLYEGFGFPPLEAMAAGIPVVSSNAASIPEVCGDAVLYFDPFDIDDMANKILKMISAQSLKEKYVTIGKKQVKKYTWEKTASQTSNFLKNLLEKDLK